jgi:hypothetical protein
MPAADLVGGHFFGLISAKVKTYFRRAWSGQIAGGATRFAYEKPTIVESSITFA